MWKHRPIFFFCLLATARATPFTKMGMNPMSTSMEASDWWKNLELLGHGSMNLPMLNQMSDKWMVMDMENPHGMEPWLDRELFEGMEGNFMSEQNYPRLMNRVLETVPSLFSNIRSQMNNMLNTIPSTQNALMELQEQTHFVFNNVNKLHSHMMILLQCYNQVKNTGNHEHLQKLAMMTEQLINMEYELLHHAESLFENCMQRFKSMDMSTNPQLHSLLSKLAHCYVQLHVICHQLAMFNSRISDMMGIDAKSHLFEELGNRAINMLKMMSDQTRGQDPTRLMEHMGMLGGFPKTLPSNRMNFQEMGKPMDSGSKHKTLWSLFGM